MIYTCVDCGQERDSEKIEYEEFEEGWVCEHCLEDDEIEVSQFEMEQWLISDLREKLDGQVNNKSLEVVAELVAESVFDYLEFKGILQSVKDDEDEES